MAATTQNRRPISQTFYAPPVATHGAPAGTFASGTKVQVGSHRVIIDKYLSEGGFSHVYTVKLPPPSNAIAVLKRVAVPDKDTLANMRNEVETMKKLRGQKSIVTYIDSHASQLKGGGYEVFLLMEFCAGGGLIDFMNTRLKNRLTEPEIVDIFGDTAEGVACMHYLKPPLIHRDLKVENILISRTPDGRKKFKLCDFGSVAPPRPAASSPAEGQLIEEDIQRHTTLQYRSPEMIDVYRHKPIDEKADVWALGVLLYKLCYYTTPFEDRGQMAILSASFKYPSYPHFSDRLKKLVAMMLMEDPARRPNIYQIVKEASQMRGKACPIPDIYSARTQSEARNTQQMPLRQSDVKSPPVVGAKIEAPQQVKQSIPEVKPMRRGRPTGTSQQITPARPTSLPNAKLGPLPDANRSVSPSLKPGPLPNEKLTPFATISAATKPQLNLVPRLNANSTSKLHPSSKYSSRGKATPNTNGTQTTLLIPDPPSQPDDPIAKAKSGSSTNVDAFRTLQPSINTSHRVNSSSSPNLRGPAKDDPFAALDTALKSSNDDDIAKAVDELSLKYPALDDDFSSLEGKGKFNFRRLPPKVPTKPASLRGRKPVET